MPTFEPTDFYDLDAILTSDERRIRESVRYWVDERFLPFVAQHYRAGTFPMELVPELAQLGIFGPSIKGHGCAGLGVSPPGSSCKSSNAVTAGCARSPRCRVHSR